MVFGISFRYLDFMVRMFLGAHLESSKLIEDCRAGQPGDQLKLIPTSPNHPSRKFRIIQLWDKYTGGTGPQAIEETSKDKTVLTPFITRDQRASNKRRWPCRRPSPLKVDLVEEARKLVERFERTLEEVKQHRAQLSEWERNADDGLDPLPSETMDEYCTRIRPILHQKW
jgi:hypothetical protein